MQMIRDQSMMSQIYIVYREQETVADDNSSLDFVHDHTCHQRNIKKSRNDDNKRQIVVNRC